MRNAMAGEDGAARTQAGELDGVGWPPGETRRIGIHRDIRQI